MCWRVALTDCSLLHQLRADRLARRGGLLHRCLLLGNRLGGDLPGDGHLLRLLALLLVHGALMRALHLLVLLERLLDDALLLHKEGADNSVTDLVVAQHTTVRAGHALLMARSEAGVDVAQRLGATKALVAEHPWGVDTLRALRPLLHHKLVARGADHLHAVATSGIVHATAILNARAGHLPGVCGVCLCVEEGRQEDHVIPVLVALLLSCARACVYGAHKSVLNVRGQREESARVKFRSERKPSWFLPETRRGSTDARAHTHLCSARAQKQRDGGTKQA
ncbi:60S ribosomal protein L34, putative [Leishmania tarentolae]|uniref:60S ribosomal protein L34, putative n=1 Tax=Leishmania tarentolae TaxID=5689 RepID=A0A640KE40_LEITA|nr:60S ribosomal protein L34, putative [Leishmania tarentolae]